MLHTPFLEIKNTYKISFLNYSFLFLSLAHSHSLSFFRSLFHTKPLTHFSLYLSLSLFLVHTNTYKTLIHSSTMSVFLVLSPKFSHAHSLFSHFYCIVCISINHIFFFFANRSKMKCVKILLVP